MPDDFDQTADLTQQPGPDPSRGDRADSRPASHHQTGSGTAQTADRPNRLDPGQLIADRFRIVAFIGRGGMGEVYRADDLELGQSVALKLLPAHISADPVLAERVRDEVRVARRITHRNVCRIHDIARLAEADGGDMFISMEYVDGDDLATLLKRIGRLPQDKAIDVARQLCAALAAAHAEGVIHRDLKPANVMLDGRGAVRLTDFGIAAIAHAAPGPDGDTATPTITGRDASVGTPAYMAPEQYEGREVTTSSDIYALGLVLYELLSGKRAWDATTHAELRSMRGATPIPAITASDHQDIDPALAALVDRCLEPDPSDRPASALAVAAALPGADPLAAALAAGETPSPELIAASGGRGVLAPVHAASIALATVAIAIFAIVYSGQTSLLAYAGSPPPPPVMREAARDVISTLGHEIDPKTPERHGWFVSGYSTGRVVEAVQSGDADWTALRTGINAPIRYWYRAEPGGFEPRTPANRVWTDYPTRDAPGSVLIQLDQNRMLRSFTRIPPPTDETPDATEPDWTLAFELAGLDFEKFTPIDARRNPGNDPAVRRAWAGPTPEDSIDSEPARLNVYLAASDGLITDITITSSTEPLPPPTQEPDRPEARQPDAEPSRSEQAQSEQAQTEQPQSAQPESDQPDPRAVTPPPTEQPRFDAQAFIQTSAQFIVLGTVTIVAGVIAYRNIRLKRGDVRRATRLGVAVFLLGGASAVLGADVAPISLPRLLGPYPTWSASIGFALMSAACYIAAEPLARSRWPGSLVSWTRLFSGRFTDPMIGRDALIGTVIGVFIVGLGTLSPMLSELIGEPVTLPFAATADSLPGILMGPRTVLGQSLDLIGSGLFSAAAVALLLLLTSLLLGLIGIRQRLPALLIVTGLILLQQLTRGELSMGDRVLTAFANLMILLVLGKFGLLAAATALASASLLSLTLHAAPLGDWWTTAAAIPLAMIALLLCFAYRTSTAGRSLLV